MLNSNILDFPRLPPDLWVIWSWNGICWPAGNRRVSYLGNRQDIMRGWALFTIHWEEALLFANRDQAEVFLRKQEALRECSYGVLNTTTVDTLRRRVNYPSNGRVQR